MVNLDDSTLQGLGLRFEGNCWNLRKWFLFLNPEIGSVLEKSGCHGKPGFDWDEKWMIHLVEDIKKYTMICSVKSRDFRNYREHWGEQLLF